MIGYDVEAIGEPETTVRFLDLAVPAHRELRASCTFFLAAKILEEEPVAEALRAVLGDPLFDIQQHTYSHMLLKTVAMDDGTEVSIHRSGTVDEVDGDIARANRLIRETLGVTCTGLTGPWGYYRGLMDRPDLLAILRENGIVFCRTFARNEKDFQPVPFTVQPFWYAPQGHPEILEFPVQGWQDCYLRNDLGYDDVDGYIHAATNQLREAAEHTTAWSYAQHDWSSIRGDTNMRIVRELVTSARDLGFQILTNREYYTRAREGAMAPPVVPARQDVL